jgi:hypothetical protein
MTKRIPTVKLGYRIFIVLDVLSRNDSEKGRREEGEISPSKSARSSQQAVLRKREQGR